MTENIGACEGTQAEEKPDSILACTVELENGMSLDGKMLENISANVKDLVLLNVLTPTVASLQKCLDIIMARQSDANGTMERVISMVSMGKDNKEKHNSNATLEQQQKQLDNMMGVGRTGCDPLGKLSLIRRCAPPPLPAKKFSRACGALSFPKPIFLVSPLFPPVSREFCHFQA